MRSVLLALAVTLAAPALAHDPLPVDAPVEVQTAPTEATTASEAYRAALRAHLAHRRAVQIERLRAYARRGQFPINADTPGLQSQLLDADGKPCAMAHLAIEDGHRAEIERLAATDNAFQFGTLTDGVLHDWMLGSGLTLEEAAFVQAPDFQVDRDLPPATRSDVAQAERLRLQAHFLAAAAQLEAYTEARLEVAVERALADAGPLALATTGS